MKGSHAVVVAALLFLSAGAVAAESGKKRNAVPARVEAADGGPVLPFSFMFRNDRPLHLFEMTLDAVMADGSRETKHVYDIQSGEDREERYSDVAKLERITLEFGVARMVFDELSALPPSPFRLSFRFNILRNEVSLVAGGDGAGDIRIAGAYELLLPDTDEEACESDALAAESDPGENAESFPETDGEDSEPEAIAAEPDPVENSESLLRKAGGADDGPALPFFFYFQNGGALHLSEMTIEAVMEDGSRKSARVHDVPAGASFEEQYSDVAKLERIVLDFGVVRMEFDELSDLPPSPFRLYYDFNEYVNQVYLEARTDDGTTSVDIAGRYELLLPDPEEDACEPSE